MTPPAIGSPRRPRLRILIRRFHPVIGGMERQCQALCTRWSGTGTDLEVWTRHVATGTASSETVDGFPVRRLRPGGIGRWGEYGSLPVFAGRLVRDRRNYDVAMVFGSGWLALAAGLGARQAGRPWLLRPATAGDITRFLDPAATPAGGPVRRRLRGHLPLAIWRANMLHRCDAVVAVSDEIAAELVRWEFPKGRIVQIPNGVDTARFRPADRDTREGLRIELGLPSEVAIVLFLGRLVARKGVLDLARAWLAIQADHTLPPACLVIAGSGVGQQDSVEGDLHRALVSAVGIAPPDTLDPRDDRPGPTIRLTGSLADPARWLAASDVFVLPSHREGLSNALLEAMSAGLRIVASDLPPTRAAVHGLPGTWLFPPGDIAGLEAALRDAINASHAGFTEPAIRDRVVADFSLDTAAERYLELFRRLTTRPGR